MTIALALLSILLVWLLDVALGVADFNPDWWLSVPSFGGFYAVLYWLFDSYLWRLRLLRTLALLKVPDLNGEWTGHVVSSYGNGSVHEVTISIIQKWSKLVVRFETELSLSYSISGSLKVADVVNPELSYLYVNEPKASAPDTMTIHRGTATLELKRNALEGDYYTGRGRMTFGSIKLAKSNRIRRNPSKATARE